MAVSRRRLVPEDHREELELRDVATQDHQADRQGAGEHQPDRAPEERPERRRDQHRDLRDPHAVAIELRLDEVGDRQLQHQEQADDRQGRAPALRHGDAQRDRERHRQVGADVREVSEHRPKEAPEHRVLHADGQQAQAEEDAEAGIDDRLHQQEAADATGRLVDELGGRDDLPLAGQSDDPVAQLLALQQHEDNQDDRQGQLAEVFEHRAEER